jgi:hypothetical protein
MTCNSESRTKRTIQKYEMKTGRVPAYGTCSRAVTCALTTHFLPPCAGEEMPKGRA